MIILHDIKPFCVSSDETIATALKKIDCNTSGIVFCLSQEGVVEGVLSDGDFRRWLLQQESVQTSTHVIEAANTSFTSALASDRPEVIGSRFSSRVKMIPLLDPQGRIMALARPRAESETVRVGGVEITEQSTVFTIAEIGINHNGCEARARELIDAAHAAGVNCVKFQMRDLNCLYRCDMDANMAEDLGVQYTMGLIKRFELPVDVMFSLFDYATSLGLIPLCTPWDSATLARLEDYGMQAYKIASADMTNSPFLQEVAQTYKPMIVSTGMSSEDEIRKAIAILQRHGASYILLHCNSTYPTPFRDVNLRYLHRLREIGGCPVGYSGHERGIHVAVAAAAYGARVIEKHITLDRSSEGPDHRVSLLPSEFRELVQAIEEVQDARGEDTARRISQGEALNRTTLAKSLVATRNLTSGSHITPSDIAVKSPGRGLQPNCRGELIGRTIRRNIQAGEFFFPSDLKNAEIMARHYQFMRPWGVTVRWHDFLPMVKKSNPQFLEFHLSYKDMNEDYLSYFDEPFDMDLKVHSPDTFEGDHLLDLANPDDKHRKRSISELQRVVNLTRDLMPYFKRATQPAIIASLGGFSENGFLPANVVKERYQLMADSLNQIDSEGVEIIGQTLPPFPWYFGGQMYLNLFVTPQDTVEFCQQNQLRICFDVSHSKLSCNHFGTSFGTFVETVGPYVAHLHLADAKGVDGEGLQIGEGNIDFPALRTQLDRLSPGASFIPEIWQGHKNHGEGFWVALERLEAQEW